MPTKCCLCGNRAKPHFDFPSDLTLRNRWFAAIENYFDLSKLNDSTRICLNHFEPKFILKTATNKYRLHKEAIPFKFSFVDCNATLNEESHINLDSIATKDNLESIDCEPPVDSHSNTTLPKKFKDKATQVSTMSKSCYDDYRQRCRTLTQTVKRQNFRLLRLEQENKALRYINSVLEGDDPEDNTPKYYCINMKT